ncbi:NAD(P)/FAD-dependent oxidoreductase [Hoylesella saccharolytica]|uniref:NAD(P)/FAD-dependent oxidoreductase n=1 Tax=Hoylesella saccharolytica TaxID=633701 RepID=UPI000471F9A6|nr:FAD-binding protein [Hoylesella saccharolytica]
MIQEYQLRLLPHQAVNEQTVSDFIARDKDIDVRTINRVRVLKKSIDARHRTIYINLSVRVFINEMPTDLEYKETLYPDVRGRKSAVVVGAGPGGLFAALRLIELGVRPIVIERGKNVQERKRDLSLITKEQRVNPESNYCFGEGGAGTFSDGKLYTRSKKRGSVEKILNVFCQHGAASAILADAHPHIGTDKLPVVIERMRNTIVACGGEVHFKTKMTSLILNDNNVVGVKTIEAETGCEEVFRGPVILATGHSARDVYAYLAQAGIPIEAKGLAVGVRLEHPATLIDQIQYHNKEGRGKYLLAAEYNFVTQSAERGVYSFCMCPGGFVIPAATDVQQIVVNGMSPGNRGSKWSNSGMVVELRPEDVEGDDVLKMMRYQEALEQLCWQQGNRQQTAPAQRMADFVNGRLSYDLPKSSYAPGLISSPLHFWMPENITRRLQEGFKKFGKMSHGFLTNEAVLIGVESRTSSPVRIIRDKDTLQHVSIGGLFPCGEGAGYAGGIVSAAIDGERCAEMCARYLHA